MASTIQIVPKYQFPHVETYINDNTIMGPDTPVADNGTKLLYVVDAPSGKDNYFVKLTDRATAETLFGKSDFSKYGQPYMQALACLDRENTSVWLMRVMPENATYSNVIISAYYKVDDADAYTEPHKRQFRIKFTAKSATNIASAEDLANAATVLDGPMLSEKYVDAEGYTQVPFETASAAGRGSYGDLLSLRMSQNYEYEKEFGIKMYNYEVLDFTSGLNLIATYTGANVTSNAYADENISTLINDVIENYDKGSYPLIVNVNEENVHIIYDEYIKFLKELHTACEEEYEQKFADYNLPEDVFDGATTPTEEQLEQLLDLEKVASIIDLTDKNSLPTFDEFDLIFGRRIGEINDMMPNIKFVEKLTDDVDITAEDYDANDYTNSDIVDLAATEGIPLHNGSNGYFDAPRTKIVDDKVVQLTRHDEVNECYINAFNGVYDRRILSKTRIPVTVLWDANYDFEVKEALYNIALARNATMVHLDTGIIGSLSASTINKLRRQYAQFDNRVASVDINHYQLRDPSTLKKITVTISYFLAPLYCDHYNIYGSHIPFARNYCVLSGHIKDSLLPLVDDFEADLCEMLYNARFNYFECFGENMFRRATQSTRQGADSDLLEENNCMTLYEIAAQIEEDSRNQLYNFAEAHVRQDFCAVEKAKFAPYEGVKLQTIDISFGTTEYEFYRSILHLYVSIVFRGLTKRVIVEIDINKRTYSGSNT